MYEVRNFGANLPNNFTKFGAKIQKFQYRYPMGLKQKCNSKVKGTLTGEFWYMQELGTRKVCTQQEYSSCFYGKMTFMACFHFLWDVRKAPQKSPLRTGFLFKDASLLRIEKLSLGA